MYLISSSFAVFGVIALPTSFNPPPAPPPPTAWITKLFVPTPGSNLPIYSPVAGSFGIGLSIIVLLPLITFSQGITVTVPSKLSELSFLASICHRVLLSGEPVVLWNFLVNTPSIILCVLLGNVTPPDFFSNVLAARQYLRG